MKNLRKQLMAVPMLVAAGAMIFATSCEKDEDPQLGDAPTEADAQFTYEATDESDNIIEFTATNSELQAQWDFGNGTSAEGTTVTATFPNAGTYTVTLTVFNSGGSASHSEDVVIENDDPSLLDDPLYNMLTGGADGDGYKVWVIDSVHDAHFGVGPNPSSETAGDYPEWYAAAALEKSGSGMYDDMYTFHLQGFQFDMETNGDVYINTESAGDFPNSTESPVGDYMAPFPAQMGETWTLTQGDEDTTLTISGDAFLGYWTGVQTYKIVNITEDELFLRFEDAQNGELAWYIRLVREGSISAPDPVSKYTLPLDFETEEPEWNAFGGSTYSYVDNPDQSGINTSSRVLQTVHGHEVWAGLSVNLENTLDFSTENMISVMVWAPTADTMRVKVENSENATNDFVELDVYVPQAQQWVEVSADFSGAASGLYDRIVLFPGWNTTTADTYYLDNIEQE